MPGERVPMRKIRDVLRLGWGQGLSQRVMARSLGLSQGVVHAYLRRARSAGLTLPLPEGLSDAGLEALLFPAPSGAAVEDRPQPDWAWVHRELRRPNVTLSLLWEEYRAGAPDGFGYSWFCDLYRSWTGRLKPTLRQIHPAGERIFVDFAGSPMAVLEGASGEERRAEIFVAVLGASSYTFACAVWSQGLADWLRAGAAGSRRTASAGEKGRRAGAPPSGAMCGRSSTSAVSRGSWSATTCAPGSAGPASTSRR